MLPEEQIEIIAKKAAKEVLHEMFLLAGVNTSESSNIIDLQKDFQYLRDAREGKDELIKKGKWAVVAVFITGTLALLLKGFVVWLASAMNGGS